MTARDRKLLVFGLLAFLLLRAEAHEEPPAPPAPPPAPPPGPPAPFVNPEDVT